MAKTELDNDEIVIATESVMNQIFNIRGQKVMLDFHLAALYEVENRILKQAVKRKQNRFPDDFMFQLTKDEWQELITICDNLPEGIKFSPATPFAFTEQGVAMLSSILNSERAVAVNIQIMRVFTRIRQMLTDNTELRLEIEKIKRSLDNQNKNIELVSKKPLNEFSAEDLRLMIGQGASLNYLIPLAFDFLKEDLLTEGDLYPSDLLKSVQSIDETFWESNPNLRKELNKLIDDRKISTK
ncbi:contact-dependent growth inhibition system immunity protein [Parapedobacter sp. DT-150]|uniref:contact-dependent growth inhibition system immunity protein n=1 Tax=Parapedobacter sp. DT-150 TaxID=3396162 RepID=UPI003F198DF4